MGQKPFFKGVVIFWFSVKRSRERSLDEATGCQEIGLRQGGKPEAGSRKPEAVPRAKSQRAKGQGQIDVRFAFHLAVVRCVALR